MMRPLQRPSVSLSGRSRVGAEEATLQGSQEFPIPVSLSIRQDI